MQEEAMSPSGGLYEPEIDPLAAPAAELAARVRAVRGLSLRLCAGLSAEDCVVQSMPDTSPVKWHLAHTTWFFETFVLAPAGRSLRPFAPEFQILFNSYYKSLGAHHPRPRRGLLTRPALEEVFAYREHVDRLLLERIDAGSLSDGELSVLELGLHHEQQHQELILMDVKHLFWSSPLRPAYRAPIEAGAAEAGPLRFVPHAGGLVSIGHAGAGFAFDNERPRHRVFLEPFEIGSRPVTGGDFMAFIEDRGYSRPELWLSDGWDAVEREGWRAPLYWERGDGVWREFTLAGTRDVAPGETLCHVSYYEADAYARWAGARLPSEAEWEAASARAPMEGNFLDSGRLHTEAASSAGGPVRQMFGDIWEWTRSPYSPYPGYSPPLGALGEYNGKFMCNQMVLRGGSFGTPRSHVRPTYRNFFYPACRWQFGGLRLARDAR